MNIIEISMKKESNIKETNIVIGINEKNDPFGVS